MQLQHPCTTSELEDSTPNNSSQSEINMTPRKPVQIVRRRMDVCTEAGTIVTSSK